MLASHDMAEVEALCDRIAILNGGHISFCGTAAELSEKWEKSIGSTLKHSREATRWKRKMERMPCFLF